MPFYLFSHSLSFSLKFSHHLSPSLSLLISTNQSIGKIIESVVTRSLVPQMIRFPIENINEIFLFLPFFFLLLPLFFSHSLSSYLSSSSSLILGSLKSCRHCILSPDLSLTWSKQEEKEWNVSLLLWMQKEDFGYKLTRKPTLCLSLPLSLIPLPLFPLSISFDWVTELNQVKLWYLDVTLHTHQQKRRRTRNLECN